MPEDLTIKADALEPLFDAWEEPDKHRGRRADNQGAEVRPGRRISLINGGLVQSLRGAVKEWRDNFYFGASETSRHLLNHWFNRTHVTGTNGATREFRYYFCQREAIETLIYLKEVRRVERLSQLISEFGGTYAAVAALGITDEEDAWSRYAFKMATGSGKTKVMSLAIVWSYFHALRESDSSMARHFVVVAPNLTVFERLKEDFKPEGGGPDIFDKDPLIPVEWRGDWNLTTVLQDEASGSSTGGTLYLTNIHRLFDKSRRKSEAATFEWMGPPVSKAKALDTGAELRDRITGHSKVMLLNDEAHHVWDPDSAWNEAILFLHETIRKRGGEGLVAQLDFSATPKDNKAQYFKHIICDTPLGEAVDAGIVKTPIIGRAGRLIEQATDNAGYRYEMHLKLGYERWLKSKTEWERSGKKPLLFVMCEDTASADQIAGRFNGDSVFRELNGRTLNLHTKLKGKVKSIGRGADKREIFVEDEKNISDEELKELRKLSRDLDSDSSPYFCVVSVLMLREGWDVRNVTTIVPLRPYNSPAGILPEQTLGRGLRRMTPPGQTNEIVAVVEHEAFARLYREELAQEGLPIEIVPVDAIPKTTVSIFPDPQKDQSKLDIGIPQLKAGTQTVAELAPIADSEVREAFKRYSVLPIGAKGPTEIPYEGRHLITNEVVEQMKVNLPLLESGVGAITFYEQQLEYLCKVKGTHRVLGPLLETFFQEILFGPGHSIFDPALVARLSDTDVAEHVRAVFVPLIRRRTVRQQVRTPESAPLMISTWRPFQVTVSERRPVISSERTLFNLVPCNRSLEQAFAEFVDKASDTVAFAKNAGPQALRIDYLADGQRLAFYTPDFFLRTKDSSFLVETKGQIDKSVPPKAKAAVEWCKSATTKHSKWQYIFVPEGVFQRFQGTTFAELARVCGPSLQDILHQEQYREELPLFAELGTLEAAASEEKASGIVDPGTLLDLPDRFRRAVDEAVALYLFFEKKSGVSYAPVFTALLGVIDEAAKTLILEGLGPALPTAAPEQRAWFDPYLRDVDTRMVRHYQEMARNLQKTLVYKSGVSPLGLLRNSLDYALNDRTDLTGVFGALREEFRFEGARNLFDRVKSVNEFRNTRVAHQEQPLVDPAQAKEALGLWVSTLVDLWSAVTNRRYSQACSVELVNFISKSELPRAEKVAEIRLLLGEIKISGLTPEKKDLIAKALTPELQAMIDRQFGARKFTIQVADMRQGSLEISFAVLAVAGFTFLKDYDAVRKGFGLFVKDMRKNCARLKKAVLKALENRKKNPFA